MALAKRDDQYATDINSTDIHTILGADSTFEGKLVFEGTVRIEGGFKGQIKTDNVLLIGPGARVEAQVEVGSVRIEGEVIGDVIAKSSVEILAPGKLRGNITTPQLMIAKGVLFEGSCKMEDAMQGRNAEPKVTLLKNQEPPPRPDAPKKD